jgi:hypothetical protein
MLHIQGPGHQVKWSGCAVNQTVALKHSGYEDNEIAGFRF